MSSKQSTYSIVMRSSGSSAIIQDFRKMQEEARRTARVIREGARSQSIAIVEARRREKEAASEALRAIKAAEQAQRRMFREQQRLRNEDIRAHQRYISSLRQQESRLRDNRSTGLKLGAAGAAGLIGVGAGVRTAANFESSMTDLRLSIQRLGKDGKVDIAALNKEMAEFEALAIRLGNALPGSTADMIEGMTELRKGGIDARTILDGAGESVANLAVLVKQLPKELAEPYAQLGQMLNLKPGDYTRSADLFARLYRTVGLRPEQLIESAKYAVPRALGPLGLEGFGGLTTTAELMGLLKRQGLEGSIAGTQVSQLMSRLTFHRRTQGRELAGLARQGIKLDFFDKKGNFAGIENFIAQMEKLKVLSQERRFELFTKLFGEEARGAAEIFTKTGVQGYRQFQNELRSIPPLQSQINELQQDFNSKLEATLGTASNVVARGFTPLLNVLKPTLETANNMLGRMEGFARENPTLAKYAGLMTGVASATLLAAGAYIKLSTSYRLWKLTSRIDAAEDLLSVMRGGVAGNATARATGVGMARGAGLLSGAAMWGTILAAGTVWSAVIQTQLKSAENEQAAREAGTRIGEILRERFQAEISGKLSAELRKEINKATAPGLASEVIKSQGLATAGVKFWDFDVKSPFVKALESSVTARKAEAQGAKPLEYDLNLRNSAIAKLYSSGITTAEDLNEYLKQAYETLKAAGRPELYAELEKLAQSAFPQLERELGKIRLLGPAAEDAAAALRRLSQSVPLFPIPKSGHEPPIAPLPKPQRKELFPLFKLPGAATGALFTRPAITGIAEKEPELALPLSKAPRVMEQMGIWRSHYGNVHRGEVILPQEQAADRPIRVDFGARMR